MTVGDFTLKGTVNRAKVIKVLDDGYKVKLLPLKCPAILPFDHLSDFPDIKALLKLALSKGDCVQKVTPFSQNQKGGTVSRKECIVRAAEEKLFVESFAGLKKGMVLPAVVKNHMDLGFFVELAGGHTGLCPALSLPNVERSTLKHHYPESRSVLARIKQVGQVKGRFLVGVSRQDVKDDPIKSMTDYLQSRDEAFKMLAKNNGKLKSYCETPVGSIVKLTVKSVTKEKVLCQTSSGLQATVDKKHLGNLKPEIGKQFSSVVLNVDVFTPCLQVAMEPNLCKDIQSVCKNGSFKVGQTCNGQIMLVKEGFLLVKVKSQGCGKFLYVPSAQHFNDIKQTTTFKAGVSSTVVVKGIFDDHLIGVLNKDGNGDVQGSVTGNKRQASAMNEDVDLATNAKKRKVEGKGSETQTTECSGKSDKDGMTPPAKKKRKKPEDDSSPKKMASAMTEDVDLATNAKRKKVEGKRSKTLANECSTKGDNNVEDKMTPPAKKKRKGSEDDSSPKKMASAMTEDVDLATNAKRKKVEGKRSKTLANECSTKGDNNVEDKMTPPAKKKRKGSEDDSSPKKMKTTKKAAKDDKLEKEERNGHHNASVKQQIPAVRTLDKETSRIKVKDNSKEDIMTHVQKNPSEKDRLMVKGFGWGGTLNVQQTKKDDFDDDDDDDKDISSKTTKSDKKLKKEEKRREERMIDEYEKQQLKGNTGPQSVRDFERLVLQSPNSSMVWLGYMAFHLELGEVAKARTVAEKALNTIGFREEQEKKNVWLAYLNLEVMYGETEDLKNLLQRAITCNDPFDIQLKMCDIYTGAGKIDDAELQFQVLIRKFKKDKSVWKNYAQFLYTHNKQAAARNILKKCLINLEKRDHVEVITRNACLEFSHGNAERGRTLFENMIASYPQRTDIWSVYIDIVIKSGDKDGARQLLERAVHQKLNAKKISFLMKKFIRFEETHGTEERVLKVKDLAVSLLQSEK